MIRMDAPAIAAFLAREFPQIAPMKVEVARVEDGFASLRAPTGERDLRPGGTVSGPAMMALADLAMYVLLLAHLGPVALAVTTSFNINFLRKPVAGELRAEARLLKLGKRLAVGEIAIFSAGATEPVAHATATYSIPDARPDT
jgi:uncharacterized protein (TIGR00369 family)